MDFQFHLRKLLQHEHERSKPSQETHLHNIHALQIYMRRVKNLNMRNTSILFDDIDVHGDSSHSSNPDDHPIWHIRTVGLQQSVIDSITVFKYRKDEGLSLIDDGTECSVCLCEFQYDENLKLLPKCSHAFHISCIDTWLTSRKNCPLCRAPIVIDASVTVVDQQPDLNVSGEPLNQENHQIIDNFDHSVAEEGSDKDGIIGISIGEISDEVLTVRRSVSIDLSSSASLTFCSGKLKRGFHKRTLSMRRSFSHNNNFLFSRYCRTQSLTLPF